MRLFIHVMLALAMMPFALTPPAAAQDMASAAYMVTYVEATPAAKRQTASLLRQLAAASRQDAGRPRFEILQRTAPTNQFVILEAWKDEAALNAHAATAHAKQFRDKVQPLLMAPLVGPDRQVYAVAQGAVATGGFAVSGASGSSVQKNHPTAGLISRGALIEKEVPVTLDGKKELALTLFHPDFTTAERVKEVINRTMGGVYSRCVDSGTIRIAVPDSYQDRVPEWMASLERLEVTPDSVAKVILNEKTGTVVLGEKVRISTVAVAHGNLSIQIKEKYNVSQPLPLAPEPRVGASSIAIPPRGGTGPIVTPGGATVVTPESSISVTEEGKPMIILPSGADLGEVVKALNGIGATPRDLITILQAIKAAGALHADLEVY